MNVKLWVFSFLTGALLFSTTVVQAAVADTPQVLLSAPWHGSYVCKQGLTRLSLTLHPLPGGDGNRVEAEFEFSADQDNPSVPTGSFRMTGTLDSTSRTLVLKQDRWLNQPADPSYRMVDLEGNLVIGAGRAMIRGRVTSYGCEDFAVWQFFAESAAGR